ncbi:MAG: hypothetical protein NXI00_23785, partial [Cytophagales bacterium]|nr:hypothetical protein [Cytophagales bacterium]
PIHVLFGVCLNAFAISFCIIMDNIREQERDWTDHIIHCDIISDCGCNNGISLHSFCLYTVFLWA